MAARVGQRTGNPQTWKKRSKKQPIKVSVPYAPTPKGKAAEQKARGKVTVPYAPTPTGKAAERKAKEKAALDVLRGAQVPPTPQTALQQAVHSGIPPSESFRRLYGDKLADKIDTERIRRYVAPREGIHADPLAELAISTVATAGIGGAAGVLSKGAKAALSGTVESAASGGRATQALTKAAKVVKGKSPTAVKDGAARAARAARGGVVRTAAGKAATKVEPAAVRAARIKALSRTARAARKVPKPIRTGAKIGTQVATAPVKRPFTAPIAAQAPSAILSGDPREFGKAFTGTGNLATISGAIGNAVASATPGAVAQNLVRDAFNLPAVALPSAYLPLAGLVEASQGDPSRLRSLWGEYVKSGAIPAALRGDGEAALNAVVEHPLYAALEASGGAAVVGRGSGALVRGATRGRVGGTARPPVYIRGQEHLGNVNELMGRGRYSPDLLRQGIQRLYDMRRGEHIQPGGLKSAVGLDPTTRALKHMARRFAYGEEQLRRLNREERAKLMRDAQPRSSRLRVDKASAGVVSQAVQRIIQRPESFVEDLRLYRAGLEAESRSGSLTAVQQKANRAMVKQLDRALQTGNAEEIVRAANTFIEQHGKIVDGLVKRGLLNADQASRAVLYPWARIHLDADYKPGVGLVDRNGSVITTAEIVAQMEKHGVEAPGFLSQKPRTPGAGAYFQSFFPERQTMHSRPRTGAATVGGTYDASYQALVEQLLYSGSKLDAAKSFDKLVRQFGSKAPRGVSSMRDAWDALNDPERFGWDGPPPGVDLRPIRVAPFRAAGEEIVKAQAHQGLGSPLLDPQQSAATEALTAQLLDAASKDGPGPYAYIPDPVFKELEGQFKRSGTAEKAGAALGQLAKSAWLPFSPSFYAGNFVDQYLRSIFAGIGPSDVRLGRQAIKGRGDIPGLLERDPAAAESIVSGAGYSSVIRQRIHRDARQFSGTPLQGFARGLEALSETHGPKEALRLYRQSRDLLLGLNSKLFERLPQYGALGKEMRRELQATSGRWRHALEISDGAFEDLLRGLRGTDKQIQYARAVEQVFSNWGKVGRAGRALSAFAPFWQWARASTRFVLLTLPAHHPVKTGLVAAAAEMTEPERKAFGLDKFAAEALPGFLQGSLPINGGIARNVPKYTSFGVFADYPEFLGRLFLPQLQTPLQTLQGLDWKGDKLERADGRPLNDIERAGLALLSSAEQFIPGLNLLESATGTSLPGNIGGETGVGKFAPWATYKGEKLHYLRSLSNRQQIDVPISGSGASGAAVDYGRVASGGTVDSDIDYEKVAAGGG